MHRVYDIFEVPPNGSPQRVRVVSGLEFAKARLRELANQTPNECFAAERRTRQIVALLNVPSSRWRAAKYIFQICYDEQLGARRVELLNSRGYDVMAVIGNEAAKLVLSPDQQYDFFIVGPAAPMQTRQEMILWLKATYPRAKILALNPPNRDVLEADYNAADNDPKNWLSIVFQQVANPADNPGPDKASTSGA